MKGIGRLTAVAVLLATIGVSPATALAETIMLARGDDTFGQGWLFLDASGQCRIATPRHVLETTDGLLTAPDLLDSFGRLHPTEAPVAAADDALDLAFLTVRGAIAKAGCSRDRVRLTPLQPIIDSIKQATLEITTPTERQSLAVAFRALSRDAGGGRIIALSTVDPNATFQKGMSGGTVMHNGRPIAMLFEVDTDQAIGVALRYDVIAAELQRLGAGPSQVRPAAAATRAYKNLVLLNGRIAHKDTSIGSFLSGASPLHLAPLKGRISLILDMNGLADITGVRMSGKGLAGMGALIVEVDNGGGFVPGALCELAEDTVCSMSPRRASSLRLSLKGAQDALYTIETLEIIKD